MYLKGNGVVRDDREALRWLKKAAEAGEPNGQYNLAAMYMQGLGLPKDDAEAAKWMSRAAEQGSVDGQFGLGAMYAHGTGVPRDLSEAVRWYRKAAEQGHAGALNNLAFLLATADDPKVRNTEEAIAVALRAVEASSEVPTYLDTLAVAYYEAGRYEDAVAAEEKALALDPGNGSYQKALGKYRAAAARHQ